MVEHTDLKNPSLWRQEPDELTLLLLGKLAEEASELAGRAARSIIQGIHGIDPDTKLTNKQELEREIADTMALCLLALDRLKLDTKFIDHRTHEKLRHKTEWLNMVIKDIKPSEL